MRVGGDAIESDRGKRANMVCGQNVSVAQVDTGTPDCAQAIREPGDRSKWRSATRIGKVVRVAQAQENDWLAPASCKT